MNNNTSTFEGILGLIVIAIIIFVCWTIFGNTNEDTSNNVDVPITYTTVTIDTLFSDWYENTGTAKEKYEDKYVSITNARLSSIDSNFKSINIRTIKNSFILDSIVCRVKSEAQKNYLKTLKSGDVIVVKGKITRVDDFGISVEIIEISK